MTTLLRRAAASINSSPRRRRADRCISTTPPLASRRRRRPSTTNELPRSSSPTNDGWYRDQVARYDASLPLDRASTPPSSWYTRFHDLEREAVLFNGWIAADVAPVNSGDYRTGKILGQPYLLTRGGDGALRGFYNVCTHAGSCLVGPWTKGERITPALVGKSASGVRRRRFRCPYHGWEFNLDGRLIKATRVRGVGDFKTSEFDLWPIRIRNLGPIAFLNFEDNDTMTKNEAFVESCQLLGDRLASSGYQGDLQDVELVEMRSYTLGCNWKLFFDNYGDGCYHCAYAHPDLSSNINESNYGTELISSELSVQHAPFNEVSSNVRLGSQPGIYAYWYPNIMINWHGPWLDIDMIFPLDDTSCMVQKAWFLERNFATSDREEFIQTSLHESTVVHDEDIFLCENAQCSMSSRGYDSSRYVPSKQVAAYHFHQRLAGSG